MRRSSRAFGLRRQPETFSPERGPCRRACRLRHRPGCPPQFGGVSRPRDVAMRGVTWNPFDGHSARRFRRAAAKVAVCRTFATTHPEETAPGHRFTLPSRGAAWRRTLKPHGRSRPRSPEPFSPRTSPRVVEKLEGSTAGRHRARGFDDCQSERPAADAASACAAAFPRVSRLRPGVGQASVTVATQSRAPSRHARRLG